MCNLARLFVLSLAVLFQLAAFEDASALVNIRNELWGYNYSTIRRDTRAPAETTTTLDVSFDADLTNTDLDPAGGITFDLGERNGAASTVLVHFVVPPCAPLSPAGTQVKIYARLELYCDAAGALHPASVEWEASWCEAGTARHCGGSDPGRGSLPGIAAPEAFELVLLDENGAQGPEPMPEDALVCAGSGLIARGRAAPVENTPRAGAASGTQSISPGTIGVWFDERGTLCSTIATPFVPFTMYIQAHLSGITSCGIEGAAFRIDGLPAGWFANVEPVAPGNLGSDPFTAGTLVFLNSCQLGQQGVLNLYRVTVLPTTLVQDLILSLREPVQPTSPLHHWPIVMLCDFPSLPQQRLDLSSAVINPSSPNGCGGMVSVQATSWSRVKGLYRN